MALTDRQLALIRSSFDALRDDLQPKSIEFYDALFQFAPGLRPMFREDLAGQGMKFMELSRSNPADSSSSRSSPERRLRLTTVRSSSAVKGLGM